MSAVIDSGSAVTWCPPTITGIGRHALTALATAIATEKFCETPVIPTRSGSNSAAIRDTASASPRTIR